MIKKTLILIPLCLLLVAILPACSLLKGNTKPKENKQQQEETTNADVDVQSMLDELQDVIDQSYQAGVVEDNIYKNAYMEFQFIVPDGWSVLNDNATSAISNIATSQAEDAVGTSGTDTSVEFAATSNDGTSNVNITHTFSSYKPTKEDEEAFRKTFEDLGISSSTININEHDTFCGMECVSLTMDSVYQDVELMQKQFYITKGGNATIATISSTDAAGIEQITKYFEKMR